ncbi:MAG: xanthine dehydrogenase family protein subunit M [Acidobacteriota bacterium]
MYPTTFDYHRATSVDHALELLSSAPDAKLLAGGHSLLPMMKLRLAQPETLIDIGRLDDLRGACLQDDLVHVGALTTHHELATDPVLRRHCPLICLAAEKIGDPAVRNRGTLGGNIAHADPASDLPAVLVALDAVVHLRGPGGARAVEARAFFRDLLDTEVRDDELLLAVEMRRTGPGVAYCKHEHPASGYAVCGAAAWVEGDHVALAWNGVTATPLDGRAVAEALAGSDLSDAAIEAALAEHLEVVDPLQDVQASGPYRAHLAQVYGRRALAAARDRARG